ncbi:hypothetical protein EOA30_32215 [Mesorhizobium sp. M8A.F.Ca.ET.059.01.1.1]|nr:hypothetical protein EOA30_32215 [Mesorhizobium sp. M8A.F.Ca.ET.059.01.1.1]
MRGLAHARGSKCGESRTRLQDAGADLAGPRPAQSMDSRCSAAEIAVHLLGQLDIELAKKMNRYFGG